MDASRIPAVDRARRSFAARFGTEPEAVVSAPGRVNLIGDHTDHQDGWVLPVAIQHRTAVAIRTRSDGVVDCFADDLDQGAWFDGASIGPPRGEWIDYVAGVAAALTAAGLPVAGWEGVLAGDVPRGSGLSSSAALELAATLAFSVAGGWRWEAVPMARIAQQAENDYVGMRCGIMDQLVSAAAEPGAALLIDCRSLDARPVELTASAHFVVMDTTTRRGLVDGRYNERRRQCEDVAARLEVRALRDAGLEDLEAVRSQIDPDAFRRARHVITENRRVLEAAAATHDAPRFGELMNESHASLRDDFEVSGEALDAIVAAARTGPGCHGARLTGAGFAGAAVALVDAEEVDEFMAHVSATFESATGLRPDLFVASPSRGARREPSVGDRT